jgi:hypothetical protein
MTLHIDSLEIDSRCFNENEAHGGGQVRGEEGIKSLTIQAPGRTARSPKGRRRRVTRQGHH